MSWSRSIALLGIQLLTSAEEFPGECPQGECAQAGIVGSSLLSQRSKVSRISLDTSSEQHALAQWSNQFIQDWIDKNKDRQFTCQVTPIEVTPSGTEADTSSQEIPITGIGATLMSAAGGLALTGQEFAKMGATGAWGIGGVVTGTALSLLTPFLFPDPTPPLPTPAQMVNNSREEIYTQMNQKVAELQACVDGAVGSTMKLAGQLSQDLAKMSHAMQGAAEIRTSLIHLKEINHSDFIQMKCNIVNDKCTSTIAGFKDVYGSSRIVAPYLMASMRMCFGFYVGWALAEFQLIQQEEADTRYSDVLVMMQQSMNEFQSWFDEVPGSDPQISEYKRSAGQSTLLVALLRKCATEGSSCKWFKPQTFSREVDGISNTDIQREGYRVRSERWKEVTGRHDAEVRCFGCGYTERGINWEPGGSSIFFQSHRWYNLDWHPTLKGVEEGSPAWIAKVYICAYGAPTYYNAETLQDRNEVFDKASKKCGSSNSIPWLYWLPQLEEASLMEQAIVERKANRALNKAKIAAMPLGCQSFATKCTQGQPGHSSAQPWLASWSDLNAAVTLCCMAGHHTEILCSKLADELLDHHEKGPNVTLTDPLCNELEDLTHIQENWEQQPSSLSREARLAQMSHYLARVHHKAGSLMQYLGGAALVTSLSLLAGASTSGALVSALMGTLVSNMQTCCENACETLTNPGDFQCACWLKGGGWQEDIYVGPA